MGSWRWVGIVYTMLEWDNIASTIPVLEHDSYDVCMIISVIKRRRQGDNRETRKATRVNKTSSPLFMSSNHLPVDSKGNLGATSQRELTF